MHKGFTAVALVVAAVSMSACMGGDEARVETRHLPRLVLQPADLSGAFVRYDEGRLAQADLPPGERADAGRFGREGGWKARYRRPGTRTTRGPLVVESRVDVFADAGGAEDDFGAYERELSGGDAREALHRAPDLGDDAIAVGHLQAALNPVQFYTVAWRDGNVVASVSANGFAGKLVFRDVLTLARKQQRRIAAAARG